MDTKQASICQETLHFQCRHSPDSILVADWNKRRFIGTLNSAAAERITCSAIACSFWKSAGAETNTSILLISTERPDLIEPEQHKKFFCILSGQKAAKKQPEKTNRVSSQK